MHGLRRAKQDAYKQSNNSRFRCENSKARNVAVAVFFSSFEAFCIEDTTALSSHQLN